MLHFKSEQFRNKIWLYAGISVDDQIFFITAFGILPHIVRAETTIPPAATLLSEGIIIEKFIGDKNFLLTKGSGAHYLISYEGKLYTCLYFGSAISCMEVEELPYLDK